MEYTCIYEALPNSLITPPFLLFLAAEFLLVFYSVTHWQKNNLSGKIGVCIVCLLLLVVIASTVYTYSSSLPIWEAYKNGNGLVAEGAIEDYTAGTNERGDYSDTFTVNGVDFIVTDSPPFGYGYPIRQCDGGVLRGGHYCKIVYVPHNGVNVIMKIEVAK